MKEYILSLNKVDWLLLAIALLLFFPQVRRQLTTWVNALIDRATKSSTKLNNWWKKRKERERRKILQSSTTLWWPITGAFFVFGLAVVLAQGFTDPIGIILLTISVQRLLWYFIIKALAKRHKWWSNPKSECFALVENNGRLIQIPLLSEGYHVDSDWNIVEGVDPRRPTTMEIELNARWIGPTWNHKFRTVTLGCHRWKEGEGKKASVKEGTEPAPGHTFPDYVPLLHSHAYVTPEIEIKGNLRVRGAFFFRFRFTNPFLAIYRTARVVESLENVSLSATRDEWADQGFDDIRKTKYEGGAGEKKSAELTHLQNTMNSRLKLYGIQVYDLHFIDLESSDVEAQRALEALALAKLNAEAKIETAKGDAEADLIKAQKRAEGQAAIAKAIVEATKGDPKMAAALAIPELKELRVLNIGEQSSGNTGVLVDGNNT